MRSVENSTAGEKNSPEFASLTEINSMPRSHPSPVFPAWPGNARRTGIRRQIEPPANDGASIFALFADRSGLSNVIARDFKF
jgi:hypothetical protein